MLRSSSTTRSAFPNASGDNVAAPGSNLTATLGAAGALTGTYYYTQTFVTANGETPPWPGTPSAMAAVAQRVELTNIPLGASGTIARKIYRTDGVTTEPKNYQFLATISDNTTTVYTDNDAANSGVFPNWAGTNRGTITMGSEVIMAASDQTTFLGDEAFGNGTPGYASTALGYAALFDNTTGRRNTAVGVYALENNTTGYENTALGVHAGGGGPTTGAGNTLIGYAAGSATLSMTNFNTIVGHGAFLGSGTKGSFNVALGKGALEAINTADACIAVGLYAGRYVNASRQVVIDSSSTGRVDTAGMIAESLFYGKCETTAIAQVMHLNAVVRVGVVTTVAALNAAHPPAAGNTGYRAFVTDALGPAFGATVVGGGAVGMVVYCDGVSWKCG